VTASDRPGLATGSAPEIVVDVRLAAPPADVFRYFTEPERYVLWQGVSAELDPRPGGIFRVQMEAGVVEGEYLLVEPPHRVRFSWGWRDHPRVPPGSSTVEIVLEADGDGTRLRLRHGGLPDAAARDLHTAGWHKHLGQLAGIVGG
jgi:uncharacterized protein YndB with AHSA1/START domain